MRSTSSLADVLDVGDGEAAGCPGGIDSSGPVAKEIDGHPHSQFGTASAAFA